MHRTIDVREMLNRPRLGSFRVGVVLLCWITAVLDGFDVQAMAFVAPVVGRLWSVPQPVMGAVLTAGLVGLLAGSVMLGHLCDRYGRRPVLCGSIAIFGLGSLLTALGETALQLMILRGVTGIGLGGVTVSALALTAEYAPERSRALIVTAMYVGFPIGGSIAGLLATPLISSFGWQSIFIAGGVLPLVALVLVWLALPESIPFALLRNRPAEEIASLVSRLDPSYTHQLGDQFIFEEHRADKAPVVALFSRELRSGTALLWLIAFANLLVLYALINWLPTLLHQAGLSLAQANFGAVVFNLGGVVGALLLSRGVDLWGPLRILAPAYACAAAVAFMLAQASDIGIALSLTVLAGAGVIGTQFCINALASVIYPTTIRASGAGWMLGFGRIGSISGPLLWGLALGSGMVARDILALSAAPLLVCCVAVVMLSLVLRRVPT